MLNMDPSRQLIGWLIRHGELKNMSIWDGWGDYELSETGKQQAEAAARWLSFERIGRAVASDIPRAMQTAQYLLDTGAVECPYLACEPNLRPWFVADFTGQKKTPERVAEFKKYLDNHSLVIPGGESNDQLHDRVQIIFQYLTTPYNRKPTAFFIHNSTIKSIMGLDDLKDAVDPGGIVAVYIDEKSEITFEVVLGAVAPQVGVS